MKINNFGMQPLNAYNNAKRQKQVQNQSKSFADRIEISTQAKDMTVTSQYEAARAAKVSKLKEEIQSGEYKVNARQVAEDMLKYYKY